MKIISAINELKELISIGACNEAFDSEQEWVTLRYGTYPNSRGLQIFDRESAQAMVDAFNSLPDRMVRGFRGLPIYIGHPDDAEWLADHPGATAEAVGRLRELRVGAEGLEMRRALNDTGKRLVSGEAAPYDSFSPNWLMAPITHEGRRAYRPQILKSIGLTNNPNIPGARIGINEAASTSQNIMNTEALRKLLAALGITIAAEATAEEVDGAIAKATEAATAAMAGKAETEKAKGDLTTAQNEATAAKAEVTQLRTQLADKTTAAVNERKARATLIVSDAIASGRLAEAKRGEWEGKLVGAANDTAFAAVETEIKGLKKAINTQSQTSGLGRRRGAVDTDSVNRVRAINEAVSTYAKEHSLSLPQDHHAAYLGAKALKPELFAATNDE